MNRGKNRALPQGELMEPDHDGAERVPKPDALATVASSGAMSLIQQGLKAGVSADSIEKLTRLVVELQEREDRKALFSAIAKAKREFPKFEKSRSYDVLSAAGQKIRTGDFAPLDEMLPQATPVLEANDLFVTWGQQAAQAGILRVTCTVVHANGQSHSECFDVTNESKAGMSPQQKYSAATSFGMRCAFMLLFGIVPSMPEAATRDYDPTCVSEEQAANLAALADEVRADKVKFLAIWAVKEYAELPARNFPAALAILEGRRKSS